MSLANRTIIGTIWNFGDQLAQRSISVIVTLLLATYLAPEEFGLMAMMAVIIAVANALMDSGFTQALIRKKDAEQKDYNTVFYANISLGLLAYFALYMGAPFFSEFYNEPQLTKLIRTTGLVVLIDSLRSVQSAILTKKLQFKIQLKAAVPAAILSGAAAVLLARIGFGVWSLVAQMIISASFTTIFIWSMSSWRPTLTTSGKSFGEMYGFGYKLFLSGLLDILFRNSYVIVIAKLFSPTTAGFYFFADRIKDLVIGQVVTSLQKASYPALSTMQDDNEKLKSNYRKLIQVTTFILFPAMTMLAALANPLIEAALPDKWLPAATYLQLICIATLMYPVHAINVNILKVKGRSELFLRIEIIKKAIGIFILFISYRYGIFAILIGQVIASFLAYIPNSYYSSRLIDYRISEQLADFAPAMILATIVGLTIEQLASASSLEPIWNLIIFSMIGVFSYFFFSKVFNIPGLILTFNLISENLKLKREKA